MNASVAEVMRDVGAALNSTFGKYVAHASGVKSACGASVIELKLPRVGSAFNYVVTMEDMGHGQRIANYSVEFQRAGSSVWEALVPPVQKKTHLRDRPDGHDPRDQYVGHKRIDLPQFPDVEATKTVAKVRLNCLRSLHGPEVLIRSFALHKRDVPWERKELQPQSSILL